MKERKSVLFVCLGNICRSPLAEGILRNFLLELGIDDKFLVDSCGTSNYHIGESPDPRTIENAARNGVILSHQARQLKYKDLEEFDHLLVMDQSNLRATLQLDRKNLFQGKIHLLRDYDPEQPGADVPDPYFGGPTGFQNVFDIIERSVDNWLTQQT